jgi:hypothetical protein
MLSANLLILLGTILIGLGGLLATYGWDLRSSADTRYMLEQQRLSQVRAAREALLYSMAAELTINGQLLTSEAFQEKDLEKTGKYEPLPRLQPTAMAAGLARQNRHSSVRSDRRLSEPQELRASTIEALRAWGKNARTALSGLPNRLCYILGAFGNTGQVGTVRID